MRAGWGSRDREDLGVDVLDGDTSSPGSARFSLPVLDSEQFSIQSQKGVSHPCG